jgi:acyl-CoA thioesterase I
MTGFRTSSGRFGGTAVTALAAAMLLLATAAGCREAPATDAPMGARAAARVAAPASGSASASTPAPAPAAAKRPRIVVLGDSIAAGLGLPSNQAFPAMVQRLVDEARLDFEVVNAGVSGDTTAGGLRRLDWAFDGDVRVLVLELGANDGLRGLSVDEMRNNLGVIMERARARGVRVVLCGMEAPPNFGPEYTRAFREAYVSLAREHDARFVPFVLAGVAGVPSLNQADGIHPNAEGARKVADLVWTALHPLLTSAAAS